MVPPTIKPVRIYRSDRGIWYAEILRGSRLKYFSLATRDETVATDKWEKYVASVESAWASTDGTVLT